MKKLVRRMCAVAALVIVLLTISIGMAFADPGSEPSPWPPKCDVVLPGK